MQAEASKCRWLEDQLPKVWQRRPKQTWYHRYKCCLYTRTARTAQHLQSAEVEFRHNGVSERIHAKQRGQKRDTKADMATSCKTHEHGVSAWVLAWTAQ